MKEKEVVAEEMTNEKVEELEVQTTFNEDGLDVLVEDGIIENQEEAFEDGNKNE